MDMTVWLRDKGFPAPTLADGQIHRAGRFGHHSKSAWYVAWEEPFPICVAGDWRTGEKWEFKCERDISRKDVRKAKDLIAKAVADANRARECRHELAAFRADIELRSGVPAEGHPYLIKKGIQAYGAIALGDDLLIPMVDIYGKQWGLQRILPDGRKFFLPDQRAAACFYVIGEPQAELYICEGFATGASVHAATGHAVFCAFSSSNLQRVAVAVKKRYPAATITIAGDNDAYTAGNPGKSSAETTARNLFLHAVIPTFSTPGRFTDFNDLAQTEGLEEVSRQLKTARSFAEDMTEEKSRKYYQLMCGG